MTTMTDTEIPPLLGTVPDGMWAFDEIRCAGCGQTRDDAVVCDRCDEPLCECLDPADITGCRYSRDVLKGHRDCVGDHSSCPDCNPDD